MRLACNKRPVAMERIERFIDELERELIEGEAKEVPSQEIGERVMKLLRELDEVAYVRFASVYRSFRDIDEFRSELDKMARPAADAPMPAERTARRHADDRADASRSPVFSPDDETMDGDRARARRARAPRRRTRTSARSS